jgi:hypothetical protein
MATRPFALLITLILAITMSCHKFCQPEKLNFNGGFSSVLPDEDSIHVGDTLWFSCTLPVNYRYSRNGSDSSTYNLSGATNVITDMHLTVPLGFNQQTGAIDSFLFVPKIGGIQTNPLAPHAAKMISFFEQNGNYVFTVGIVALKKGIYFLFIVDIYQAMKNCDKISVAITMHNGDSHLHYLKDIYYGGGPIAPLDSTHGYCFRVY